MAGNSQRKGAMRKEGSKKGAVVGSGGQRRKALKGKGPTPKASERTGHPAARRSKVAQKAAAAGRPRKDAKDILIGRNPVVEALRAGVPASALYVQQYVDTDDRVREAVQIAADQGMPLL
ncbi:MAG: RNA methyltransferase substrate-binding domain-containing protein, partial [Candidatus Nanopelagicales bacterium]